MPHKFQPPKSDSLAVVDVADDVSYGDQCVDIEGVVSPSGQGVWPGPSQGYDVHFFAFGGWRQAGEAIVERELTLLRPVPPSSWEGEGDPRKDVFERFPKYSIQRLRLLLSQDRTRAVVDRILTLGEPDAALVSLAARLRKPTVLSTKSFGELVLDPSVGRFEGTHDWQGKAIRVRFEKSDKGDINAALKTAQRLWSNEAAWAIDVEDFAVKNESWLEEDEAEVTPEEFKARMELVSISFARNGQFEFSYDDGGLFLGHSIQVSGNLKDGLRDAAVAG